jgi:hypothetical protein
MARKVPLLVVVGLLLPSIAATPACAQSLVAAVLPSSRSIQLGATATAFATLINAGTGAATGCGIALGTSIPATLSYQTTDPGTNVPIGTPDTPVSIAPGQAQTFVLAITPTATINPTDVRFMFTCTNASPVVAITGVNTLLLSVSAGPVPDLVALAATVNPDNTVGLTGGGAFSVATINVGAAATITVNADTGSASLPVSLFVCGTNAAGACQTSVLPSVTLLIPAGATPTFSVFASATGTFVYDPAITRAFVRFKDAGGVIRGSTSVGLKPPIQSGLSGTWLLTGSGTATADNGGSSPYSLTLPPFSAAQTGDSLSGTVLFGSATDLIGLPPACTLQCGNPGSCSLTCPGLTCNITCAPATASCAERDDLTGTVSGSTLNLTLRNDTLVQASCAGLASGTLFAHDTTVTNGVGTIGSGGSPTATGTFSGRANDSCGGTGDFADALECVSFNFSGTFTLNVTATQEAIRIPESSNRRAWDALLRGVSSAMAH